MSYVEIRRDFDKIVVNFKGAPYLWFSSYMDGYYMSTLVLLDKLNLRNDALIYPLLFNFSQYLELWIKLLVLASNDTNDVKQLKIGNHTIEKIIKETADKSKDLLETYNVSTSLLYDIANMYLYFLDYTCQKQDLSISARYPLNNAGSDIIINFDKIEGAKKDCYAKLKVHISEILSATNKITRDFFLKYFQNKIDDIALP